MLDAQLELERKTIANRTKAWQEHAIDALASGNLNRLPLGHAIISEALRTGIPSFEDQMKRAHTTDALSAEFVGWINAVGVPKVLSLALNIAIEHAAQESTLAALYQSIGKAIYAEYCFLLVQELNPWYATRLQAQFETNGSANINHITRTMHAALSNLEISAGAYSNADMCKAGRYPVGIILDMGLIELAAETVRAGKRPTNKIGLHPEVVNTLQEYIGNSAPFRVTPVLLDKPAPIRQNGVGGMWYTQELYSSYRLITGMGSPEYVKWYNKTIPDVSAWSESCARASSVKYRINPNLYKLLGMLASAGMEAFKLPTAPVKPKLSIALPAGVSAKAYMQEHKGTPEANALQEYMEASRKYHVDLKEYAQHKREMLRVKQQIRECMQYPEFALPTYVDTRGRLYYMTDLTPAGTDIARAALQFSSGVPLGEHGLMYLKAHLANCLGYDSTSIADRAAYVDRCMDRIKIAVGSPIEHADYWGNADAPLQAYAAAVDVLGALASQDSSRYVSRIITQWDATCSGLQHYSAMLRDKVGADCVNLTNLGLKAKASIYTVVADAAIAAIRTDLEAANQDTILEARYWLGVGITKKLAKKPVMTYLYSAGLLCIADYIQDNLDPSVPIPAGSNKTRVCMYAAQKLIDAIEVAVPLTVQCMRWLKDVARSAARDGKILQLRTAQGALVPNLYYKERELTMSGTGPMRRHTTKLRVYTEEVSPSATVRAICPNVVHACDAMHLHYVLSQCTCLGIQLSLVHDSYGAHAGNAHLTHRVLREEFVSLYSNYDPLRNLYAAYPDGTSGEPLECPIPKGTLDIKEVINSEYLFC